MVRYKLMAQNVNKTTVKTKNNSRKSEKIKIKIKEKKSIKQECEISLNSNK